MSCAEESDWGDEREHWSGLRRNTVSEKDTNRVSFSPHLQRSTSCLELSSRLTVSETIERRESSTNQLNTFDDIRRMSKRTDGFENSFGHRKVFDGSLEATVVNANSIARIIASILHEMITFGEMMASKGHCNGPQYDVFCSGGRETFRRVDSSDTNACSIPVSPHREEESHRTLPYATESHIPDVEEIASFVTIICLCSKMEYECIVIALIYVRRLIKNSNGLLVLRRNNWKSIFLSSVIVSNKIWDDFHMSNSSYSMILKGVKIERINALELNFFLSINCRCNVSPSAFAETHFEIQDMITKASIQLESVEGKKGKLKSPNNKEKKKVKRISSFKSAVVHSESMEKLSCRPAGLRSKWSIFCGMLICGRGESDIVPFQ